MIESEPKVRKRTASKEKIERIPKGAQINSPFDFSLRADEYYGVSKEEAMEIGPCEEPKMAIHTHGQLTGKS